MRVSFTTSPCVYIHILMQILNVKFHLYMVFQIYSNNIIIRCDTPSRLQNFMGNTIDGTLQIFDV